MSIHVNDGRVEKKLVGSGFGSRFLKISLNRVSGYSSPLADVESDLRIIQN